MADNIEITQGAGTKMATDDCATVHYSKVKLIDGTADSTTPIDVDIGAKANALRVAPANDITDATYIGDIKFGEAEPNSEAIKTAVQLIDNAIDGNCLNVNVNAAGTDLSMNAGVLTAQTQRVTIATDDECNNLLGTIDADTGAIKTAVEIIDNAISGNEMQVDIVTVPAPLNVVGGGTEATALRVTIANDSTGVITVDGTVTANLSAVDNAVLDNIFGALDIIDKWDGTHAGEPATHGVQILGMAYSTALPADVGADTLAARICTDRHGRIVRGLMPQWFNAIFDSADASAEANVVKAKTADRKIYILSLTISVDAEMWVKLQDEDSNALTCKHWFKAGGGKTITYPPEAPLVLNVVNKDLEVITEGAGNIGVEVTGYLAV